MLVYFETYWCGKSPYSLEKSFRVASSPVITEINPENKKVLLDWYSNCLFLLILASCVRCKFENLMNVNIIRISTLISAYIEYISFKIRSIFPKLGLCLIFKALNIDQNKIVNSNYLMVLKENIKWLKGH